MKQLGVESRGASEAAPSPLRPPLLCSRVQFLRPVRHALALPLARRQPRRPPLPVRRGSSRRAGSYGSQGSLSTLADRSTHGSSMPYTSSLQTVAEAE